MKEKTLSTKYYRVYKIFSAVVIGVFLVMYLISFTKTRLPWISVPLAILYLYVIVKLWYPKLMKKMKAFKRISYNDRCLWVQEKDFDIEVPLDRVKSVDLVSLDGLYKFEFFDNYQFGDTIYCKPSMWYPLNYPKVDKELDRIRFFIRKRKEKVQHPDRNLNLASQNE